MSFVVQPETPSFHEDASGAVRVGNSRVLLALVIRAFKDGATPETIVQRYSTLALPDVYVAIAYYLRHMGEVETYLQDRRQLAEEVQRKINAKHGDLSEIRSRLLAKRQT